MDVDLTPNGKKPPREGGAETRADDDLLDITQDYLKNVWLAGKNKTSTADRSAVIALGLSVAALILVGGISAAVFVYAAVLLVALVPQIRENQGKKEIAAKAGRVTLLLLPLFVLSLIGVYIAPLAGAAAIVIGALQFGRKGVSGKKRSASMWAIVFSTIAIMLSIMLIGVSIIGKSADPYASFAASRPEPAPDPSPVLLPTLNPPDYMDRQGLEAYRELKHKGYQVKAVFGDRSLTDKYGEATELFESLDAGKTAKPAENFIVGGVSQTNEEVKLTIVVQSAQTDPPAVTGNDGGAPTDPTNDGP